METHSDANGRKPSKTRQDKKKQPLTVRERRDVAGRAGHWGRALEYELAGVGALAVVCAVVGRHLAGEAGLDVDGGLVDGGQVGGAVQGVGRAGRGGGHSGGLEVVGGDLRLGRRSREPGSCVSE